MKQFLLLLICCLFGSFSMAQDIPGTEIFLVNFSKSDSGKYVFDKPENATLRAGYDNQPHFLPDGKGLVYSSIREDGKSDIYRYDFESRQHFNLTQTSLTAEYSPTIMPDGKHLSVVMVEEDDETQRLWQFSLDGREKKKLVEHLTTVGYHHWLNRDSLVFFLVGEPNVLTISRLGEEQERAAAMHIGRCIQAVPNEAHKIYFTHAFHPETRYLKVLDVQTFDIQTIATCFEEQEDYVVLDDGSIWMGHKGKLFQLNVSNREWIEIADFTSNGIDAFNRMAIDQKNGRLAIVVGE